ncbi:MAG: hypothetical protein HGA90_05825, partial [Alphaproteobacteria bacterium]|nr:hypothetical protein [Alphaproteobacteria bacterium]
MCSKVTNFFAVVLLAAVMAGGVVYLGGKKQPEQQGATAKESAFDRVLRTGTLRCAYIVYPP